MDEDSIRLVLRRASELRSKITNIHTLSSNVEAIKEDKESKDKKEKPDKDDTLLNICNALESLEAQLSSLQALQQQQWHDKEMFLAEIDNSRKRLLQKLKEHKGEDALEVIQAAIAFASSTVEIENHDLLLPPYTNPPSHLPFTRQISQNGLTVKQPSNKLKQSITSVKGWRQVIGATAKIVLGVVGFVGVVGLSGFEPKMSKNGNAFKVWGMSREKKRMLVERPPGKVLLVVENGETRCLVKERVEIPFVSVATTPDVNYGCG